MGEFGLSEYIEQLDLIQKQAESGNLEQAFEDCESILSKWPSNTEVIHLSAYILILKGMPEKAVDRLMVAISMQPENHIFHSTLAVAYQSDGNIPEACACYRRVLELQPNDQHALVSLAEIGSMKGLNPEVIKAEKASPERIMGYLLSGSLKYSARAMEIDPSDPGAVGIDRALDVHLRCNLIGIMDAVVPEDIGRGKQKVIYPLRVIGRIGHLIAEPFLLKCLFDPNEYDIVILTMPRDEAVSVPIYDIAMRQTFPVEVEPTSPALELWGLDCGIQTVGDRTYVLEDIMGLGGRVMQNLENGKLPYRYTLDETEQEQGRVLRQEMDIPAGASIVTLYVREEGYLPGLNFHGHRNSDIQNYISAIKFLVKEGYYVIRIGDDKMHRLPDLGPQVVDAPFHHAYNRHVEAYFVSESSFMIKTSSGPEFLSMAFGIPSLLTNHFWSPFLAQIENDLCVPKKYYSHRYQRELSLSEIATDKELLFSNDVRDFTSRHIQLIENTDLELLSATKEMVHRLRGNYEENEVYDTKFRDICRRIHEDCQKDIYSDSHMELEADYFSPYLGGLKISHTYCDSNPNFLR